MLVCSVVYIIVDNPIPSFALKYFNLQSPVIIVHFHCWWWYKPGEVSLWW